MVCFFIFFIYSMFGGILSFNFNCLFWCIPTSWEAYPDLLGGLRGVYPDCLGMT